MLIRKKHSTTGVTLLEVILVLVIMSAMIVLGMQQYLSFQRAGNVAAVKQTADNLFYAMSRLYKTVCYGTINSSGAVVPGALNPLQQPPSVIPINIPDFLVAQGFLSANIPLNPLIDSSVVMQTAGSHQVANPFFTNGFITQFNKSTPTMRQVCTKAKPNTQAIGAAVNCQTALPVGQINGWTVQVAVNIYNPKNDPNVSLAYLNLLQGDCLSSISAGAIAPCTGYPGSGNYVVWSRLPSMASQQLNTNTTTWQTMITQKQFNQMYSTYNTNYLLQYNGYIPDWSGRQGNQLQTYLCGD